MSAKYQSLLILMIEIIPSTFFFFSTGRLDISKVMKMGKSTHVKIVRNS